jgi:chromosome segregation ATPase
MQERIQSLLHEMALSERLLHDEQNERIQAQTLLSDFEAEFADEMYQKSQQIVNLRAEIDRLVRSSAEVNEWHSQLAQLMKSSDERRSSFSAGATSQEEIQAFIATLRMSLETSQKLHDNLVAENRHIHTTLDSLAAEVSQLKGEKAALAAEVTRMASEKDALLARFESLSDELLLITKQQPHQVQNQEASDTPPNFQPNASAWQQPGSKLQQNPNDLLASLTGPPLQTSLSFPPTSPGTLLTSSHAKHCH